MTERTKDILHFLLAALIAVGFGWWSARHFRYDPPETIVKTDTVVVVHYDTTTAIAPDPADTRPRDTVYIKIYPPEPSVPETHESVPETKDSVLYLPVVIEQKVYQDSTYRAVVSGPSIGQYGPSLDTISVYQRTKVITVTNNVRIPPPRWSWGVQAGVGLNTGGTVTPYLGVGIQYRLGDFEIRK